EILAPDQLAAEVVTVKTFGAEVDVNVFAIGDRSRRGVCSTSMAIVEDRAVIGDSLPEDLARIAIEAKHFESVKLVGAGPIGMLKLLFAHHMLRGFVIGRGRAAFDRGCHEYFFLPDDGR